MFENALFAIEIQRNRDLRGEYNPLMRENPRNGDLPQSFLLQYSSGILSTKLLKALGELWKAKLASVPASLAQ